MKFKDVSEKGSQLSAYEVADESGSMGRVSQYEVVVTRQTRTGYSLTKVKKWRAVKPGWEQPGFRTRKEAVKWLSGK